MSQCVVAAPATDWPLVVKCAALVAAVQFFVALEGSMLLPLGPMLSDALGFPTDHLGYLNSSFLAAAAIAGLIGSLFLDRFERRVALSVALGGLAVATGMAALASSLEGLMWCRFIAGLCGGPAAALGLAVIGDTAPVEVRGRAIGAVAAGSGLAIILGVPLALVTAEWVGWRVMFLLAGLLGLALALGAALLLPNRLGHLSRQNGREVWADFRGMLAQRSTLMALGATGLVFASTHALASNLASYLVYNLGVPQSDLKFIWSAGGVAGLAGSQLASHLSDRLGAVRMFWGVSVLTVPAFYLFFVQTGTTLAPMLMFCVFMACVSARFVLIQTINSLASRAGNRGRFMSLIGANNQAASALILLVCGQVLYTAPGGALVRMDWLGWFGICAALLSAWLAWLPLRGNGAE
ncbi:MFS transporter [Duganella sp. BuS-21]|uniref:MFS transporter n=1 Tax=Duganella sp. BuS-21 TaxID=2943848 RepID=UPI0035A731FB